MNNNILLFDFLKRLSANNNRDWFQENKEEYTQIRDAWMADLNQLILLMAQGDPTLQYITAKECAYRIYRDVRFSKNKAPYKTYFSAVIAAGGRKDIHSCYYLHMQPDGQSGLFGGVWCPEPKILKALRHAIDDNVEEFENIIQAPDFAKTYNLVGDTLKTMPKDFPRDSPNAKYIKMKEFLLEHKCSDNFFSQENWIEQTAHDFLIMKPFHDFLNFTIDEE